MNSNRSRHARLTPRLPISALVLLTVAAVLFQVSCKPATPGGSDGGSNGGRPPAFANLNIHTMALSEDGKTLALSTASENPEVHLFSMTDTGWKKRKQLSVDKQTNTAVGIRLALSDDGNTLAVAVPASSTGRVHIYGRNGTEWTMQDTVTGTSTFYGFSVALSGDGKTLAVGTVRNSPGRVKSTVQSTVQVLTRSDANKWTSVFASSEGGYSTALNTDGTVLAVGSPTANAVRIFSRSGDAWAKTATFDKMTAADLTTETASYGNFGYSVSLSGGGKVLAVGAPTEGSLVVKVTDGKMEAPANKKALVDTGAAYVFSSATGTWKEDARLKPGSKDVDQFGYAVALSTDGAALAVGAINMYNKNKSGATTTIFSREGGSWTKKSTLGLK